MKKYAEGGSMPKGIQLPEKTQAEITAERMNRGKSTVDLLKEDKAKTIKKKMEAMPPMSLPEPGDSRPGVGMSEESRKMMEDTDAGYEYTKKKPFKKGGSVKSSASKRADGIAQRGKTKGMMR